MTAPSIFSSYQGSAVVSTTVDMAVAMCVKDFSGGSYAYVVKREGDLYKVTLVAFVNNDSYQGTQSTKHTLLPSAMEKWMREKITLVSMLPVGDFISKLGVNLGNEHFALTAHREW